MNAGLGRRCDHLSRRCIHGDEVWPRMRVCLRSLLFWWAEPVVPRQECLDCGAALDLDPICVEHPGQHVVHEARNKRP